MAATKAKAHDFGTREPAALELQRLLDNKILDYRKMAGLTKADVAEVLKRAKADLEQPG